MKDKLPSKAEIDAARCKALASGGIREILMNYPSLYQAVLAGFAYQRHLREEAEKEAEGGDE
jgi:hypothetical protein